VSTRCTRCSMSAPKPNAVIGCTTTTSQESVMSWEPSNSYRVKWINYQMYTKLHAINHQVAMYRPDQSCCLPHKMGTVAVSSQQPITQSACECESLHRLKAMYRFCVQVWVLITFLFFKGTICTECSFPLCWTVSKPVRFMQKVTGHKKCSFISLHKLYLKHFHCDKYLASYTTQEKAYLGITQCP
jgi:hypothetical protein